MSKLGRRTALKLVSGSVAWAAIPWAQGATNPGTTARVVANDKLLSIAFDQTLRTSIAARGQAITGYESSECLLLKEGVLDAFDLTDHGSEALNDPAQGVGRRHTLKGRSAEGIEKIVTVTFFNKHPGVAIIQATYRNAGTQRLAITGWRNAAHELADAPDGFWSFSGATHEDRRDWVQPVKEGFEQRNTLSMAASDYGGGTPVANIWRRDVGIAVGHIETVPRLLDLPVRKTSGGASIAIESAQEATLEPGQSLTTDRTLLSVHAGDHYSPLSQYQHIMRAQGLAAPRAPASAFSPVWCAWGYERHFTTEQVLATLPKVHELGFGWAVMDDGWQNNEGDWEIDRTKFPRGEDDMRAFVKAVKAQGMRPRLWLAPLAADPGSDVLHDHADMLLLDHDGSVQKVSWWNAFTQCPAYQPTVDYYVTMVRKIIGDWGFEGIKLDGQHLNAVAPCFNRAHKHAHPSESCEKLADFWSAIHKAAHEINPDAVIELCPCGTAFAFHNLPATDQYPASDPLSSWQVRSKGKSVKALMGLGSSYAGDHVELSDGGDDFASSVGVGAVISTKFTWPKDTTRPVDKLPPGGFVLTPQKETMWRKWVALYKEHMLPTGEYRGELYDIGFDKPETHAISKSGKMYYSFYANEWSGQLQLRGLGQGKYRVRDLFNEVELGVIDAHDNGLNATFKRFLLLQATPV